jgi:hypothetical protein
MSDIAHITAQIAERIRCFFFDSFIGPRQNIATFTFHNRFGECAASNSPQVSINSCCIWFENFFAISVSTILCQCFF